MDAPAILQMRRVGYRAGAKTILDAVDWTIRPGERWALLGPNGAGKTTLLKLACGYLWPNAGGEILRLGRALLDLRELRQSIGWVSLSLVRQIPPDQPVIRTVLAGRLAQTRLWQCGDAQLSPGDERRARTYLEQLDAADLGDRPFAVLSQGEQQKVLIARARMARPMLIILDEPCAGLDPGARERFLASLAGLTRAEPDLGLVLVTHHVEEILPGFDRTLVLREGTVMRAGPTDEVVTASLLGDLYGLRVELIRRAGRHWPVTADRD